ncbi:hypothetical protein BpJC4_30690 [Weizmannia acidilactici]|nr:hypothetical protein BpJC4_30690 [Weizmannia acidilactici]
MNIGKDEQRSAFLSKLVVLEVAMEKNVPELYNVYFGDKALLYYNDESPFS